MCQFSCRSFCSKNGGFGFCNGDHHNVCGNCLLHHRGHGQGSVANKVSPQKEHCERESPSHRGRCALHRVLYNLLVFHLRDFSAMLTLILKVFKFYVKLDFSWLGHKLVSLGNLCFAIRKFR